MDDLATVLATHLPFSSVDEVTRQVLIDAARTCEYEPGQLILDAFAEPTSSIYLVLDGHVGVWNHADRLALEPDENLGVGGLFGYSATMTGRSIGPRATALSAARVACLPGNVAMPAFVTKAGARFLAENLLHGRPQGTTPAPAPLSSTAGDLVGAVPLIVRPDLPAREVARLLTEQRRHSAIVELGMGEFALVTDASLRQRILVDGMPLDAPAAHVVADRSPVVAENEPAAEALIVLIEEGADAAVVLSERREPVGVVTLGDFSTNPVSADVGIHLQLRAAPSTEDLIVLARQIPDLLDSLLHRGLESGRVIEVYSTLVDSLIRRAIELEFASRPDLSTSRFTWIALGSNGRREAVLSSDIDSAVSFDDSVTEEEMVGYREAFTALDTTLLEAGIADDKHGVSGRHAILSRTQSAWGEAADAWLADPFENKGAIMTSLLVDGRAILGSASRDTAEQIVDRIRDHPLTLRLLLRDALARRAKGGTGWESWWRKPERYDVKEHALLPLVNLARWAALAVHSRERSTTARLHAAAGSPMITEDQATTLAEVFTVLQRLRLRYQLMQFRDGQGRSDAMLVDRLSPIDRSVVAQAVREIAAAQRRLANVGAYVDQDQWVAPGGA